MATLLALASLGVVAPAQQAGALFPAGSEPIALGSTALSSALHDVDGDGPLDLVVLHADPLGLSWLRNLGDGAFAGPEPYGWAPSTPVSLSLADLDDDGSVDTLVVMDHGLLYIELGDGTPGYALSVTNGATGSVLADLEVRDLDGDGHLDLITANEQPWGGETEPVSILRGDGSGLFTSVEHPAAGADAANVEVGDFDGSGDLDLVITSEEASEIQFLQSSQGAGYSLPVAVASQTAGYGWGRDQLVSGDFDGDGTADVVAAMPEDGSVIVALGGTAGPQLSHSLPSVHQSQTLAAADLDVDGDLDVLGVGSSPWSSTAMRMLQNDGTGTLAKGPAWIPAQASGSMLVDDVTGDGLPDVITHGWADALYLSRSTGPAGFPLPRLLDSLADSDIIPWYEYEDLDGHDHLYADLDGQGWLDQVAVMGDLDTWVMASCGDDEGLYDEPVLLLWIDSSAPWMLQAGDLDLDGLEDVLLLPQYAFSVHTLLNEGACQFADPVTSSLANVFWPASATGQWVADMDGDGLLDFAMGGPDTAYVLPGAGDGTFEAALIAPMDQGVWIFREAEDLDLDGDLDLLAIDYDGTEVTCWSNQGDGTFAAGPSTSLETDAGVWGLADLDGDGVTDLLAAGADQRLWPHLGVGDGTFVDAGLDLPGSDDVHWWWSHLADVDQNGTIDVFSYSHVAYGLDGLGFAPWTPLSQPVQNGLVDIDGDDAVDLTHGQPHGSQQLLLGTGGAWVPVGEALAGSLGEPTYHMGGMPQAGIPIRLQLGSVPAHAAVYLVFGLAATHAPLKGGVLIPDPSPPVGTTLLLTADSAGSLELSAPWPAGIPAGQPIWTQCWIMDAAAPTGMAATAAMHTLAN